MPTRFDEDETGTDRRAPDVQVTLTDGTSARLSQLCQDATLVLVFLRHFG